MRRDDFWPGSPAIGADRRFVVYAANLVLRHADGVPAGIRGHDDWPSWRRQLAHHLPRSC